MKAYILIVSWLVVSNADIYVPQYIESPHKAMVEILHQKEYRTVILLGDRTSLLFQELSQRLRSWPTFIIDPRKIREFNGPFHNNFNYGAIAEESRMYIFVTNTSLFQKMLEAARKLYFWRDRQNILVLLDDEPTTEELEENFKICWKYWVINIVILVGTKLYTYDPFPGLFHIEVDRRSQSTVFYNKIVNLHRHVIRMSVFPTALDAIPIGNDYMGRDADLSKTLTKFLNASMSYKLPTDGITYGLRFKNGSMTGVFADVVNNITDFTMNSRLVKLQFENVLEGTYPHDWEDLVGMVPKSARAPEYQKFTKLFPEDVWLLFIGTFVVFAAFWYLLTKKSDISGAFLDSYTIGLGNAINDPTNIKLRLVLLVYVSYLFFLLNAYKGLLTSILTVPIGLPEINTLEELDSSGFDIYIATRFKDMLQDNVGASLTASLVSKMKRVPDDPDIDNVIKKRGRYAIILKETFAQRAILDSSNYRDGIKIYRIMKERPMPSQVCFAVKYGSPMLPRVNQLLRRFQESGLNNFWKASIVHRLSLENLGFEDLGTSVRVLTMDNLTVATFGLVFGLIVSTFIFFAELLIYNIRRKCN